MQQDECYRHSVVYSAVIFDLLQLMEPLRLKSLVSLSCSYATEVQTASQSKKPIA
jgi:hypothetical protein